MCLKWGVFSSRTFNSVNLCVRTSRAHLCLHNNCAPHPQSLNSREKRLRLCHSKQCSKMRSKIQPNCSHDIDSSCLSVLVFSASSLDFAVAFVSFQQGSVLALRVSLGTRPACKNESNLVDKICNIVDHIEDLFIHVTKKVTK